MYCFGYGLDYSVSSWRVYQVIPRPSVEKVIAKADSMESQEEAPSFCAQDSRVVGLCTGAFAAAAVSCSSSIPDLVPNAVDAVITAFRTGMLVTDVAERLDQSHGLDQSWAILVPGSGSSAAVHEFCEQVVSDLQLPSMSKYCPIPPVLTIPLLLKEHAFD